MKFTHSTNKIKPQDRLLVAFDVSKDKLNFYLEYGTDLLNRAHGELKNRTPDIIKCLQDLTQLALDNNYPAIHVLCESTGDYEKKLMRSARQLGCATSYVSGEKVNKFKVVESNDTGKTDLKDSRVILLLGKLGKESIYRHLDGEYAQLRRLNQLFDSEMKDRVQVRCRIHRLLIELFCDYSFKKDFFYSPSGQALMQGYGFSPYRIVKAGYKRFKSKMHRLAPRIKHCTIDRLWQDAQSSVLHQLDEDLLDILEMKLEFLAEEYHLKSARLENIRSRMVGLYYQLLAKREPVPKAQKGFATPFQIARVLGETGPLRDFNSARELLKYAGMNLIQRQSGKYRGKERISKKGRARLRHVVNQAVLPLLKRSALYGKKYHAGKEKGKIGKKLTMAVMRKFLTMFFAIGTTGAEFDAKRVFTCESKYLAKAA